MLARPLTTSIHGTIPGAPRGALGGRWYTASASTETGIPRVRSIISETVGTVYLDTDMSFSLVGLVLWDGDALEGDGRTNGVPNTRFVVI